MVSFKRTFDCNKKPVPGTFTPAENGLLAVTAELKAREGDYPHEMRASGGAGGPTLK